MWNPKYERLEITDSVLDRGYQTLPTLPCSAPAQLFPQGRSTKHALVCSPSSGQASVGGVSLPDCSTAPAPSEGSERHSGNSDDTEFALGRITIMLLVFLSDLPIRITPEVWRNKHNLQTPCMLVSASGAKGVKGWNIRKRHSIFLLVITRSTFFN